jgi:hypothetical protein
MLLVKLDPTFFCLVWISLSLSLFLSLSLSLSLSALKKDLLKARKIGKIIQNTQKSVKFVMGALKGEGMNGFLGDSRCKPGRSERNLFLEYLHILFNLNSIYPKVKTGCT